MGNFHRSSQPSIMEMLTNILLGAVFTDHQLVTPLVVRRSEIAGENGSNEWRGNPWLELLGDIKKSCEMPHKVYLFYLFTGGLL